LFDISPSESPPSGRGPGLVLGVWDFIDSTTPADCCERGNIHARFVGGKLV